MIDIGDMIPNKPFLDKAWDIAQSIVNEMYQNEIWSHLMAFCVETQDWHKGK